MQRYITSILFVAGTCIGGGTIALPMVLSKIGILPSVILMVLTWALTYYTSLVSVELNLQSERGLSLGELGRRFSGRGAEIVGEVNIKLLSYSLLSAYLYGGTSVIHKLLEIYFNCYVASLTIETLLAVGIMLLLLFPLKIVSKVNNVAFAIFALIFLALIASIAGFADYKSIPWVGEGSSSTIASVVIVVVTSFGYQVIFHTLRDYCGRDATMLKRTFFYGSLIPVLVYIIWTTCSLSVIYKSNPEFFASIVSGEIDVGDLVGQLATITGCHCLQVMVWWMSILAILTSIFGVGVGLAESLNVALKDKIRLTGVQKISSAVLTVLPAYVVAAMVPNAFIKILGFAGAIIVIIAIWMPTYLLLKAKFEKLYIKILNKGGLLFCCAIGLAIVLTELLK